MELSVVIDRSGYPKTSTLIVDGSRILLCSPRARTELLKRMGELNSICSNCRVVVRSDELTDGMCKEGIGCTVDVDRHLLDAPIQGREREAWMELESLPNILWETFTDKIPRRGDAFGLNTNEGEGQW